MSNDNTPTPTPAPAPIPFNREELRQNRALVQDALEQLVREANVEIPEDYDLETAFVDVLAIGTVDGLPPDAQGPLARLGLWLFERLPR